MALRAVILLTVSVMLGAVTTLGVAWGLAKWVEPLHAPAGWEKTGGIAGRTETFYVALHRRPGAEIAVAALWSFNAHGDAIPQPEVDHAALPAWCAAEIRGYAQWGSAYATDQYAVEARGWPSMALACEHLWPLTTMNAVVLGPKTRGFGFPVALPCRPIWSGIVMNTCCYTGAWLLLFLLPSGLIGAVRRRMRVRQGRCPHCGYDLRGVPGAACPECGGKEEIS